MFLGFPVWISFSLSFIPVMVMFPVVIGLVASKVCNAISEEKNGH